MDHAVVNAHGAELFLAVLVVIGNTVFKAAPQRHVTAGVLVEEGLIEENAAFVDGAGEGNQRTLAQHTSTLVHADHLAQQVVTLAGTLADAGEDAHAGVFLCNVVDKFLDNRRAKEQEKKRKAKEAMEAAKALEEMTIKLGDETKTKEQLHKDLESREKLPKEETSEVLAKYKICQMQILDSYSPMYEFED